jgi:hypothetical protein
MWCTRRGTVLAAMGWALARPAHAERIMPEPVFPNLPPALPPADFTAMPLFIDIPLRLTQGRPTYEATKLSVEQFLTVLPSERSWKKHTVGNVWFLTLRELTVLGETLHDVFLVFEEDDLAGPHAVSFRLPRIGQKVLDPEAQLRFARTLVEWTRNAT